MGYGDQDGKIPEKKNEPHADRDINVAQFQRMIARVYWVPEYMFEQDAPKGHKWINYFISDSKTESVFDPAIGKHIVTTYVSDYKCLTFCWGIGGEIPKTSVISFSQVNKDREKQEGFAYEFANALNYLGEHGFLVHCDREANGTPRKMKLHNRMRALREPRPDQGETVYNDKDGNLCMLNIWVDVPDRTIQTVHREPNRWEQLETHLS